jgi:hypothetical protein
LVERRPLVERGPLVASFAKFTKGSALEECTDVTIVIPPEKADAGEAFLASMIGDAGEGDLGIRLSKPCAEDHPSSVALATCSIKMYRDKLKVLTRHYDLDSLIGDDHIMKDCLESNGDWSGVDKRSPAYRNAIRDRARHEVGNLRKTLGKSPN